MESEWKIAIDNQRVVIRPNTILLLYLLMEVCTPNYDFLPAKPNESTKCTNMNIFKLNVSCTGVTLLLFEEKSSKALALEGNYDLLMTSSGYKGITKDYLLYNKVGDENPKFNIELSCSNLVVFACKCKSITKLLEGKNRLVVEPSKIKCSILHNWKVENKDSCIYTKEINAIMEPMIITLTMQDMRFLLTVINYHLLQLRLDFFDKACEYYRSLKSEYQKRSRLESYFVPSVEKPTINYPEEIESKKTFDLLREMLTALASFQIEQQQIQILREQFKSSSIKQKEIDIFNKIFQDKNVNSEFNYSKITQSNFVVRATLTNDIKAIFINDFAGVFYPIFEIEFAIGLFQLEQKGNGDENISCEGKLNANYYNCSANAWEPLLEPFRIIYKGERKKGNVSDIKISLPDVLNIIVSKTAILLLEESWLLWNNPGPGSIEERNVIIKRSNSRKSRPTFTSLLSSSYEAITEFTIRNQSGVEFYVIIKDSPEMERQLIEPNESLNLSVDPSETLAKIKRVRKQKFCISIEFGQESGIPPIENLDLSKVKEFVHPKDVGQKEIKQFLYYCCTIKVEQMRKVLSICTPVVLTSEINFATTVCFPFTETEEKEYFLDSLKKELSIPTKLLNNTAKISVTECSTNSSFTFQSLLQHFETKKSVQIVMGPHEYGVMILNLAADNKFYKISLLPPYCILNGLPLRLKVRLMDDSCDKSAIKLETNESTYIYSHSTKNPLVLMLYVRPFKPEQFSFDFTTDVLSFPNKFRTSKYLLFSKMNLIALLLSMQK